MAWTKQEVKKLKENGYKQSSSSADKYVHKSGYGGVTRHGNWTSFENGEKKHDISLSRLSEKTKR